MWSLLFIIPYDFLDGKIRQSVAVHATLARLAKERGSDDFLDGKSI